MANANRGIVRPLSLLCICASALAMLRCSGDQPNAPPQSAPAALSINSTVPPAGVVGLAYSHSLTASGGTGQYSWSVQSGVLPAGVALSASGTLSGTPTTVGSSNFTVTVTSGAQSQSRSYSIIVTAPVPSTLQIVRGHAQTQIIGLTLPDSLAVRVQDRRGAALPGTAIRWTVSVNGGTVSAESTITDADGVASVSWIISRSAGTHSVTANVDAINASLHATAVGPIDTHSHLNTLPLNAQGLSAAAQDAAAKVAALGISRQMIMPPPLPSHPVFNDPALLQAALQPFSDRLIMAAGGYTLNPIIHEAFAAGSVTPELRARFEAAALDLLNRKVSAFGELAAMHLSLFEGHPFEDVPADHELFLRLADIAASADIALDLHLDPVVADIALPSQLATPPNPVMLRANIPPFERLLAHNRAARIVWVHLGTDFTGHRSPELVRRLLTTHANLYISIRQPGPLPPGAAGSLTDGTGRLKATWSAVFRDFPDRFVLGSDHFFPGPGAHTALPQTIDATMAFLGVLPPDLAYRFGYENARRIYRLE
ncbi:MAG TPA: putative Ig domain-containing protein [Vicinamibacterales bacterium]|nr:putative Ig domain-containing protein [Vicinamibacterales bacterium]